MSNEKLLLDLGGTNLRMGYGNLESFNVRKITKLKVDTERDISNAINTKLAEQTVDEIIFSVAGPRDKNTISMTNRNLILDGDDLRLKFDVDGCHMLNDWESIGYCLPLLNDQDIILIKDGLRDPEKTSLAIGPGTGLGFSVLRHIKGVPYVFATELGNTQLYNDFFTKLFKLEDTEGFSVLEDFISGVGLAKIYHILYQHELSAETIVKNYLVEERATNLINAFVFGLTSLISDLKLSFLASGGIYLAGSLMRSLYNKGALTNLEEIFNKHKSKMHSKILRETSISLIIKEHTPLYGNLNYSNIRRNHE